MIHSPTAAAHNLKIQEVVLISYSIIVNGNFHEGYEEYFSIYSEKVSNYLSKHSGVVIRRQKILKSLYGDQPADMFMLIDFPNREIAESIFYAEEYLDIIPLRDKIFKDFNMYLSPSEKI